MTFTDDANRALRLAVGANLTKKIIFPHKFESVHFEVQTRALQYFRHRGHKDKQVLSDELRGNRSKPRKDFVSRRKEV